MKSTKSTELTLRSNTSGASMLGGLLNYGSSGSRDRSTDSKEEKVFEEEYTVVSAPSIPKYLLPFISRDTGGAKEWMIPVPYAANLTTNGSGLIAAALTVSSVAAASSFTSLAALFDEFYVEKLDVKYQPATRYQVLPSTTTSEFNGTALGLASTYLDTVAYTNINQMPANPTFKFVHTSSPFTFVWRNNVKRKSAVSVETSSSLPSLSWVRTNASTAQYYGGTVQIIGSASSAMHASTVVGVICFRADCWFRSKA